MISYNTVIIRKQLLYNKENIEWEGNKQPANDRLKKLILTLSHFFFLLFIHLFLFVCRYIWVFLDVYMIYTISTILDVYGYRYGYV